MNDLFEHNRQQSAAAFQPLADRMRPRRLSDLVGQNHLTEAGSLIRTALESDQLFSMILWGPPGCGKTTLAHIIAHTTGAVFISLSAVLSGVSDIRKVIDGARDRRAQFGKTTILFVDEVHRFNKSQQDAFLPHVENGLITLIGATTENPSFAIIPALMSRCRLITMEPVPDKDMAALLQKTMADTEHGLGQTGLRLSEEALAHLVSTADGDVRTALNGLEAAVAIFREESRDSDTITLGDIENAIDKKAMLYDKSGEEHFNLISALHKSLRGSDPDAAVYWLERMMSAGEDPFYIIRRMVRFASEDVGNADPNALQVALAALESYRFLGSPEGDLAMVQAAVYLATAPKSNSLYQAHNEIKSVVKSTGYLPVPRHIRNAPTALMKSIGYGRGYKYAHDYKGGFAPQEHLPDQLAGKVFYHPTSRGYEQTIKSRLDGWRALKKKKSANPDIS
ncbi:MAG: replication-associated recombination protein A [Desulfosudaceae bacterium]